MRRRLPLLLSMAALLILAVVATRGRSGVPHGQGLLVRGGAPQPVPAAPPAHGRLGPGLDTVVGAGFGVLALFLVVGLVIGLAAGVSLLASLRRVRGRRVKGGPPVEQTPEDGAEPVALTLLRGARSALAELRQRPGGPPADAVQRAWLAMEHAAAEGGTARRPEQTPTEFTSMLLAEHSVDGTALATLRAIYQRARFGRPESVTEADASAALTAMDRIAADLAEGTSAKNEVRS